MKSNLTLKRIGAYIIDLFIISVISSLIMSISFINPKYKEYVAIGEEYNKLVNEYYDGNVDLNGFTLETQEMSYQLNRNGYVYIISDIIILFAYFGVFAYFRKGQTIGKYLLKIKVVSNDEKRELKPYNYFIRVLILNSIILNLITLVAICFSLNTYLTIFTWASNLDTILLIVIFLMVFVRKDKRGLHDVIAGTKVIDLKQLDNKDKNEEKNEIIKPKKIVKKEK